MMIEPRCYTRKCKHYLGIIQPDGTEQSETNCCKAFPKGIPDEIAYGDNQHTEVISGQVGTYVFESA